MSFESSFNSPNRLFVQEVLTLFPAIFGAETHFANALQPLQITDGVRHNTKAFSVKTNNTPVVFDTYNTDPNIGFGTGTGNTSRYPDRVEIIYEDVDVEYDYPLAVNEGFDPATVNNDMGAAINDRIEANAKAHTRRVNTEIGKYISLVAGNPITMTGVTEAELINMFEAMVAFYTDSEVTVDVSAYVTPAVYTKLLTSDLMTTDKNSRTNIDTGIVGDGEAFGFEIFKTPSKYFATGDVAYFIPNKIVLPFTGIQEARIVIDPNHAGQAFQELLKGGTYISPENAEVVSKIKVA